MLERFIYKAFLLEQDVRKQLRACPPFLLLPVNTTSRERTPLSRAQVIIPARERKLQTLEQIRDSKSGIN